LTIGFDERDGYRLSTEYSRGEARKGVESLFGSGLEKSCFMKGG
jgi:hypothetical protein